MITARRLCFYLFHGRARDGCPNQHFVDFRHGGGLGNAVVPNASVTATNEATGVSYRQQTTEAGLFAFPRCPRVFTASAWRSGFKTYKRSNNVLQVGSPLVVDVQLEIGQSAETVSVSCELRAVADGQRRAGQRDGASRPSGSRSCR